MPGRYVKITLGLGTALLAAAGGCAKYAPLPLTPDAVERALTVPAPDVLRDRARGLNHPLLRRVDLDDPRGLTPEAAAVLAVIVSPSLRAERGRLALSSAQLLQAGLLPNPQLSFTLDPVTGGNTAGTVTGYLVGLDWDLVALITHQAKVAAARAQGESVRLDVAWQEWQVAQAAKKSAYDLLALRAQVGKARDADRRLSEDVAVVRRAVEGNQKTLLDLAAAETTSQKVHSDLLALERDLRHQELAFHQALGLPPGRPVRLREIDLPSRLDVPSEAQLLAGLEDRRLDLAALRRGYQSQEQVVRAAVLAQFPKLVLNVHQASDTSNVHTTGAGITADLPIFDRNQGSIAVETATRRKLFDEYVGRVFEARSTIAIALSDIGSIAGQIADAEAAVPGLERLVRAYRTALDQGNADVLSYYTAQSDLAEKQIEVLKLKQQLLQGKIALEIAAGQSLPDPAPPSVAPSSGPASRPASAPAGGAGASPGAEGTP